MAVLASSRILCPLVACPAVLVFLLHNADRCSRLLGSNLGLGRALPFSLPWRGWNGVRSWKLSFTVNYNALSPESIVSILLYPLVLNQMESIKKWSLRYL